MAKKGFAIPERQEQIHLPGRDAWTVGLAYGENATRIWLRLPEELDITVADAATVRNLMQEYLSPRQKERLGNQLGAPLDELEVQWVRLGAWQSEKAIPPRAGKEESE